jgi:hypothetical protein
MIWKEVFVASYLAEGTEKKHDSVSVRIIGDATDLSPEHISVDIKFLNCITSCNQQTISNRVFLRS